MTMNPKYILLLLLLLCTDLLHAQNAHFTTEGEIEFEKTINMYAMIKKNMGTSSFYEQAYDAFKKSQPQFKVLKSKLTFGDQKSLFAPVESKEITGGGFFGNEPTASQNNIIFNDLKTGMSTSQKNVYEEIFLVRDTTRKIKWKITDEKREIAGYNCRRANGLMMDSVYVVAFYTDKIPVSSGPESFSGLPGMILGVALPHENITWFAKKVTDRPVVPKEIAPPTKGKAMDLAGFKKYLNSALKEWGEYAKPALKAFQL
ncbi:GLPGLI family protein [Pedobacter nutrimenti]|uniref:GLPGLI family protein n=2 Tax=Pedobacter nutrimenti TaxID=1241337 RepID=A0A318UDT1_9SPHI|nr:GLPGLI family protein [Pedobacter nutrimenti]